MTPMHAAWAASTNSPSRQWPDDRSRGVGGGLTTGVAGAGGGLRVGAVSSRTMGGVAPSDTLQSALGRLPILTYNS